MNYQDIKTLLHSEILTTYRQAFSWLTPLLFFVIVISLFPLALGPEKNILHKIAPGIIWVAMLLSILISIGALFRNDAEAGHLDVMLLSPHSLPLLVSCKILSFWITHCLPLILLSPLLGLLFDLTQREELLLFISLLLGTPSLCLLGAIGSALSAGLQNAGLLLPVLIMPLYVPVLIFGTGAVMMAGNYPVSAYFAMMGAFLLMSLVIAPLLASAALRIGVDV